MSDIKWETIKRFTDIRYERFEGIAKITINRPEVRNAFRPLTVNEMREALQSGEISSAELTELHISRIETCDDKLNAIPVKTFDRAREAAKSADKRIAAGESAPLLGLPMTLKESTLVEGLPQTAGLEGFKGYLPPYDGTLATRTFEAGAGLLGKTNMLRS